VTPTVVVGQVSEEDYEEAAPVKNDEPLNKALQLLKANNGEQATLPVAQTAPAAGASATPPAAEKKPGFWRRLFGAK